MTLITIWLDGIDEEWSVVALDIGFDDQRLYDTFSSGGMRRFSEKGATIYRKLTALSGVSAYMPTEHKDPGWDRTVDRLVVRRTLACYRDGGFAPALKHLLTQIASKLSECGLGDFKIQYFVSYGALRLIGTYAEADWPIGPGELPY